MDYIALLRQFGKKMITKPELETIFQVNSDDTLFPIVEMLKDKGVLQAVKSSLTNGNNRYPISLKYRITLPEESYDEEMREISVLHPILQFQGYLQHRPEQYRKYRSHLRKLDKYLFQQVSAPIAVSRKERSFEIFDEEKVLDDRAFCTLLENLGVNAQALCFYDTPEYCFNDYIPEMKPEMTLLICENKDIWFNIRRIMFEEKRFTIFEAQVDGVVYGCGNKVSQKEALTTYTHFMGGHVNYLYWGDIDRTGLDIYLSLNRSNPELAIQLFVPAYEEMLRLAENRSIPDSGDARVHHEDYDGIFSLLSEAGAMQMRTSILQNKRIPQEIISYAHLKEIMR